MLRLIRQHKTNAAIATELQLSLNTVKFHVANMLAKLEVPDREALADWSLRTKSSRQGERKRRWFEQLTGSPTNTVFTNRRVRLPCPGFESFVLSLSRGYGHAERAVAGCAR